MRTTRSLVAFGAVAALSLGAVACSSDDDTTSSTGTTDAPTTTAAAAKGSATIGDVEISNTWARTSPMAATVGAVYGDFESAEGDALVSASVDASIAGKVELHETKMVDGGMTTESTMAGEMPTETTEAAMATETTMAGGAGEMEMVPVEAVDLPAGELVQLKPGGLHIMLLELVAPLEEGTTIEVELTFESGATGTITVPVLAAAP